MAFEAVIFDLYGTLVDNFGGGSFTASLRQAGVLDELAGGRNEDFAQVWGSKEFYEKRLTGEFQSIEESILAVCRRVGGRPSESAVRRAAEVRSKCRQAGLVPRPGTIEALNELKRRGLKLGLMSGAEIDTVRLWPTTAFAGIFDATVFTSEAGALKPSRRLYELVCERLGVAPQACIYVGDGDGQELAGAKAVGMESVLICAPHEEAIVMARDEARNWRGPRISAIGELSDLIARLEGTAQ